jgi:hypothetical protein
MAYTAADGSAAVYRVSPNHGVFTVTTAIPATTPLAVPGLGTPKPARLVKVCGAQGATASRLVAAPV